MAIVLLMDQTDIDAINVYTSSLEPFETPLELGRPDKPWCVQKRFFDNMFDYLERSGTPLPDLVVLVSNLETVTYDKPLWKDLSNHIPTQAQVIMAPIGSWTFVLEGSSVPSGTWLTQATKMAIPSNLTPAVLPANLHVVSMTWINETDGANEDIELYVNGVLAYTWSLPNSRWAIINAASEFSPVIALAERSLVSARLVNISSPAAKDGILTIYFRLVGGATAGEYISATLGE